MNNKYFTVCGLLLIDGRVLLVRHTYGTAKDRILLPGGYVHDGELPTAAVEREIFEETGLRPQFISGFFQQDEYHLSEKPGTWKQVTYFLAEFGDETPIPQEGEIRQIHLVPYEQALQLFCHENNRRILTAAHAFLTKGQKA